MASGVRDTRAALVRWRADRWRVLATWAFASLGVAVALLTATWVVATVDTPDAAYDLAGVSRPAEAADVRLILIGNALVLTLHAMACVAAYLARRSIPLEAAGYGRVWRSLHQRVGSAAMAFVACATLFSFATQARILGATAAAAATGLGIGPATLLLGLAPHALPELTAVFLPLAAWAVASRRRDGWNDLLAATLVTTAVAAPVLVAAALIEVYVSPHLILALAG